MAYVVLKSFIISKTATAVTPLVMWVSPVEYQITLPLCTWENVALILLIAGAKLYNTKPWNGVQLLFLKLERT